MGDITKSCRVHWLNYGVHLSQGNYKIFYEATFFSDSSEKTLTNFYSLDKMQNIRREKSWKFFADFEKDDICFLEREKKVLNFFFCLPSGFRGRNGTLWLPFTVIIFLNFFLPGTRVLCKLNFEEIIWREDTVVKTFQFALDEKSRFWFMSISLLSLLIWRLHSVKGLEPR